MISKEETIYLVNRFFEKCFEFWANDGKSGKEAFDLALKETAEIKHNPFVPMGDLLDPNAQREYIEKMRIGDGNMEV